MHCIIALLGEPFSRAPPFSASFTNSSASVLNMFPKEIAHRTYALTVVLSYLMLPLLSYGSALGGFAVDIKHTDLS